MSTALRFLMNDFARHIGSGEFVCLSEGKMQFLCQGKLVINLQHDAESNRIQVFAAAGFLAARATDQPIDLNQGEWSVSERVEDGFAFAFRRHIDTGLVLTSAAAPMEQLDAVRFTQWMTQYLDDLVTINGILTSQVTSDAGAKDPDALNDDDDDAMFLFDGVDEE